MFKFEEICELIQLVGSSGVANVEVEHAGSRVRIEGRTQVVASVAQPVEVAAGSPVGEASSSSVAVQSDGDAATADDESLHGVVSPIVGTFYRAPNPDADPYVKLGDFVEPGQTLCIVEAMKLMNEIECDVSGTVVRVLPENAQAVEYGENLFMVRPA